LAAALTAQGAYAPVRAGDLVELPRRGLAHRHWRLRGRAVLLRAPLLGGPSAAAALARQAEAFRRMSMSGHAPRLHGTLMPTVLLPGGALIVEEIRGRAPVVPRDFPALAAALAAIHALPLPPEAARAPLPSPADPFSDTLATIERHLESAWPRLSRELRMRLTAERDWARRTVAEHGPALRAGPRTLVVTDTHPRNCILRADGRAVCVDLEKAMYGAPAIDLAHAMLPAAIAWGRQGERVTEADRDRFVNAYLKRRGTDAAGALGPEFELWRRLTALRTTAAFAAFRASGAGGVLGPAARRLARRAMSQALEVQTCANGLQKRDWTVQ
ncbi:MAG: phosphotransferase, partial [Alphaproteobacteria bacterium]|nr:phosphotransferase [Alphaproteobacteria bacterium]